MTTKRLLTGPNNQMFNVGREANLNGGSGGRVGGGGGCNGFVRSCYNNGKSVTDTKTTIILPNKKIKSLPHTRIHRTCMSKPACPIPSINSIVLDSAVASTLNISEANKKNGLTKKNFMIVANNSICNNCNSQQTTKCEENCTWSGVFCSVKSKSSNSSPVHSKQEIYEQNTSRSSKEFSPKLKLHKCDSKRTLRFLVSELKSQLHSSQTDEKNIKNILLEIQQTVERIDTDTIAKKLFEKKTKEIASNRNLEQDNQKIEENRVNKTNSSCQTDKYNSSICENALQTDNNSYEFQQNCSKLNIKLENIEIKIKNHYEKLTDNYISLENICKSLKNEKSKISNELSKSQDEILMLKNQIYSIQDITDKENGNKEDLKEKYKSLHDQVKTLQDSRILKENEQLSVVESLNEKLKESSERICTLEKSRIQNEQILIFTKLENEKLMMMEKYRAHQIKSMENTIANIHKFIKHELKELQEYLCKNSEKTSPNTTNSQSKSKLSYNKIHEFIENSIKSSNKNFPLKKLQNCRRTLSKLSNSNMIKLLQLSSLTPSPPLQQTLSKTEVISTVIDAENQIQPTESNGTSTFIDEEIEKKNSNCIYTGNGGGASDGDDNNVDDSVSGNVNNKMKSFNNQDDDIHHRYQSNLLNNNYDKAAKKHQVQKFESDLKDDFKTANTKNTKTQSQYHNQEQHQQHQQPHHHQNHTHRYHHHYENNNLILKKENQFTNGEEVKFGDANDLFEKESNLNSRNSSFFPTKKAISFTHAAPSPLTPSMPAATTSNSDSKRIKTKNSFTTINSTKKDKPLKTSLRLNGEISHLNLNHSQFLLPIQSTINTPTKKDACKVNIEKTPENKNQLHQHQENSLKFTQNLIKKKLLSERGYDKSNCYVGNHNNNHSTASARYQNDNYNFSNHDENSSDKLMPADTTNNNNFSNISDGIMGVPASLYTSCKNSNEIYHKVDGKFNYGTRSVRTISPTIASTRMRQPSEIEKYVPTKEQNTDCHYYQNHNQRQLFQCNKDTLGLGCDNGGCGDSLYVKKTTSAQTNNENCRCDQEHPPPPLLDSTSFNFDEFKQMLDEKISSFRLKFKETNTISDCSTCTTARYKKIPISNCTSFDSN